MRPIKEVPIDWDVVGLSVGIDRLEARKAFEELGLVRACETLLSVWSQSDSAGGKFSAPQVPEPKALLKRSKRVCLVSCSANKTSSRAKAQDLYTSPLFKKSRQWAELLEGNWYILSAKYGLVSPETRIAPYDESLKDATRQQLENWGIGVVSKLRDIADPSDLVFLLAGSTYSSAILSRLLESGYRLAQPLQGMSIGRRLHWLKVACDIGAGSADLEEFYEILSRLASGTGGFQPLVSADRRTWPERGVYFFFEPGENRLYRRDLRVVRVGTHAVSANSKSTLWNRLRTHRGAGEGGGNHRSSIFRSHIGTAILHRDGRCGDFPYWGDQAAGTPDNRTVEAELEKLVSVILSRMSVLCLNIPDTPGPRSDRAYIERNAIALLAAVGRRLDVPSRTWLGMSSPHPSIRASGLWNVDFVDEPSWDSEFLDILDYYVRATIGKVPYAGRPVAPHGWGRGEFTAETIAGSSTRRG